jgi:hypothetical protein
MKIIMERWRYECDNSGTDPFINHRFVSSLKERIQPTHASRIPESQLARRRVKLPEAATSVMCHR